jgi:hypothetical protein
MEMEQAFLQVKSFIQMSLQSAVSVTESLGVMPPALSAPFPVDDITMEKL